MGSDSINFSAICESLPLYAVEQGQESNELNQSSLTPLISRARSINRVNKSLAFAILYGMICISLVCCTHRVIVIDRTTYYTDKAFLIPALSNAGLGL